MSAAHGTNRLTKIVCTLGPSCFKPEEIRQLAEAGMNVARINLSHGESDEHKRVIGIIKELNEHSDFHVGILLDTKGAEIRTGDIQDPILIEKGEEVLFVSDADHRDHGSAHKIIHVNYDSFGKDVRETERILIDNGELSFDIVAVDEGGMVTARAREAGSIGSRRHVNLPGADINLPSVTEKDWLDIAMAADEDVEFIALSFIRTAEEVQEVRAFLDKRKSDVRIITKVETAQAVQNIDSIIQASDGIMVARGDLGAEVPFETLPVIQDDLVSRCQEANKPVIVATHMLESMTAHPLPTRAEVTDVAHAAATKSDATMLSGETASGRHPTVAVDAMDRILRATERHIARLAPNHFEEGVHNERQARAQSAVALAKSIEAAALLVITHRGQTAQELSKFRPAMPIVAVTDSASIARKLSLTYGAYSTVVPFSDDLESTVESGIAAAKELGYLKNGDSVVLLSDTQVKSGTVTSVQVRTV